MKTTFFVLGIVIGGCTPAYQYTPSSTATSAEPPKAKECEFELVTVKPQEPVEQLGILDYTTSGPQASNANEFKDAVREKVCKAGGDLVLAEVNGEGKYIRGTVLRRTGPTDVRAKESPAP